MTAEGKVSRAKSGENTLHKEISENFTQQNSTFMVYILHKYLWSVKGGFGASNVRRQRAIGGDLILEIWRVLVLRA